MEFFSIDLRIGLVLTIAALEMKKYRRMILMISVSQVATR